MPRARARTRIAKSLQKQRLPIFKIKDLQSANRSSSRLKRSGSNCRYSHQSPKPHSNHLQHQVPCSNSSQSLSLQRQVQIKQLGRSSKPSQGSPTSLALPRLLYAPFSLTSLSFFALTQRLHCRSSTRLLERSSQVLVRCSVCGSASGGLHTFGNPCNKLQRRAQLRHLRSCKTPQPH